MAEIAGRRCNEKKFQVNDASFLLMKIDAAPAMA
jgi:hypothetical protein